jgi:hypothetical protein
MEWSYRLNIDSLIHEYTGKTNFELLEQHQHRIDLIKKGEAVEMLDPTWKTFSLDFTVTQFLNIEKEKEKIQQQDIWIPSFRKGEKKRLDTSKYGGTAWLAEGEK